MRNLYNILEGILDDDFDVSPDDLLIGNVYSANYSATRGILPNRFEPMGIYQPEFKRVEKAVPHTNFPIKIKDVAIKRPWFGNGNPFSYLMDWAVSQPISIVDNNELTEKKLFEWIPKSKNIRAEWWAPKNLIFYYKGRSQEHSIINLILCEK